FDTRIDAEDGLSVITTIDSNIQSMLEGQLKSAYEYAKAAEKVTGIVMDPNTGAIYAMGTYPSFDLNDMYTLNDYYQARYDAWTFDVSKYPEGTTEEAAKNEYYWECVYAMWNNKAVSTLYEPGSTMKMMTTAMALEESRISFSSQFSCSGALTVAGQRIRCHKTSGHGTKTFNKLLQLSCNPAIMQVAAKLGGSKFYSYFESFGYTSLTGVDLPGEEAGLYVPLSGFNAVELACYSFGQTFKTTPLQQLTAVCTIANGGNLVTPYVVSSLIDSSGNAQVTFEPKIKRQVVSSSVCESIMTVLEDGVSSGDGVKNAYVAGYRVAAKTGTSEKRDSVDKTARIGSCVAVAPADDPQVCVIIIVDEPQISNKYGSNVAAPYAGALIEQVLSYLGVERRYTDEETSRMSVTVGNYKGIALEKAIQNVSSAGLTYEVIGNGTTVTSQIPAAGETLTNMNGKVYLYTGGETATTTVKVPDLMHKTADAAIKQLQALGLNVRLTGVTNYSAGAGATVIAQSPPAGTEVPYGSIVTLECRYLNETDGG
ncbi:MAG: PASTA domain-containing protein, partial [Clostridia bacterium]|nr:PASTA domain-containing protein [Clostridia bacterium]